MDRFGKECDGGYEESVRFRNFESNDEVFYATDAQNLTFQLGHYVFVDPRTESCGHCTSLILRSCGCGLPRLARTSLMVDPLPLLWTGRRRVTAMRDQAPWGPCWSFSTPGSLKGALVVVTDSLASLSEQQFVDGDTTDCGCDGDGLRLRLRRERRHLHRGTNPNPCSSSS